MKNIAKGIFFLGLLTGVTGCASSSENPNQEPVSKRTVKTENLLKNLKQTAKTGIMFGHQDDTVYGIGWEGDDDRSDVKSVCGDYPAVISFDLGHIEIADSMNLDRVPFKKIRKEIIKQYERGGMISLSWHLRNPKTGGDSWDVSDSTVVRSILPGGDNHQKFSSWLDRLASFMNSLEDSKGDKIPVLFRPWHEHTGSWFWWGADLCTPSEYKALWSMVVDSLQSKGVNHLLYAYSSGAEPKSVEEYLERYPGDSLIDLVGFDTYQMNRDNYLTDLQRGLAIIDSVGKQQDKVIALTETGYEGIPDSIWWTGTLLPIIQEYPLAYVLVWRNARERITHYYAPYPGQASSSDFVRFYECPTTIFLSQLHSLYQ